MISRTTLALIFASFAYLYVALLSICYFSNSNYRVFAVTSERREPTFPSTPVCGSVSATLSSLSVDSREDGAGVVKSSDVSADAIGSKFAIISILFGLSAAKQTSRLHFNGWELWAIGASVAKVLLAFHRFLG